MHGSWTWTTWLNEWHKWHQEKKKNYRWNWQRRLKKLNKVALVLIHSYQLSFQSLWSVNYISFQDSKILKFMWPHLVCNPIDFAGATGGTARAPAGKQEKVIISWKSSCFSYPSLWMDFGTPTLCRRTLLFLFGWSGPRQETGASNARAHTNRD